MHHMLQLNPTIPMSTKRGAGYALMVLDYSQEHDLIWVIALTENGEIWAIPNSEVRLEKNYTFNRITPPVTVE